MLVIDVLKFTNNKSKISLIGQRSQDVSRLKEEMQTLEAVARAEAEEEKHRMEAIEKAALIRAEEEARTRKRRMEEMEEERLRMQERQEEMRR